MTDFRKQIEKWISDLEDIEAGTYGEREDDFDIALTKAIASLETLIMKFPTRLAVSIDSAADEPAQDKRYQWTLIHFDKPCVMVRDTRHGGDPVVSIFYASDNSPEQIEQLKERAQQRTNDLSSAKIRYTVMPDNNKQYVVLDVENLQTVGEFSTSLEATDIATKMNNEAQS